MSIHHEHLIRELVKEYMDLSAESRDDVQRWMDDAAAKAAGYSWGRLDEAISGSYDGICVEGFSYAYAIQIGKVWTHQNGSGVIPALREAWSVYTTNTLGKVVLPVA